MKLAGAAPPFLFVYGTLRDADVFRAVTGVDQAAYAPTAARLPGARILAVPRETYPALGSGHGSAEGCVLKGVAGEAWSRLLFFEAGDYVLRSLEVLAGPASARLSASVFWPAIEMTDGAPWSFEAWQSDHKASTLIATETYMGLYHTSANLDLDAAWEAIKSSL